MNDSEAIVERYLRLLGFTDIVYEPDGNVPPDFLAEGRIAVEVRRLNQHERAPSARGLEVTQVPLLDKMRKLLASLGPPNCGASWFLSYRYRRPIEPWPSLRSQLHRWLSDFRQGPQAEGSEAEFGSQFSVSLVRAAEPHEHLYLLGGFSDGDAGGWLLSEIERNLRICISEKSRKTAAHRAKYQEWWLALVDRIGYGLSELERERFRASYSLEHDWDRVLLVSPLEPSRAFQL